MPCRSPYDEISKEELEQRENAALYELNLTTRFIHECLTKLEKENLPIPEYMKDWWEKHKKSEEVVLYLYELNLTTRFACECLTDLEKQNLPIPEYIKDWWEKHKEWDRIRKEIEQARKDEEDKEIKKFQQITDAVENGVEALFPPELLKELSNNEN